MPLVAIDVSNKISKKMEVSLMKSVYVIIKEVFSLSDQDISIRLTVHETHRFSINIQEDVQNSLDTIISIDCFPGRSIETKKLLFNKIFTSLELLGIPRNTIKIVLREISKDDWGL
ncbi:MAG: hypothetical protein A3E88_01665 [Legionellales bacterium RIFCSPHIGHO2_12_FULL_35_11]|nr:MAG: hypothetical protein A3E88_01665 [Legionellales bacterium RIFCSPHIGHO2_12_FULL_35_11]